MQGKKKIAAVGGSRSRPPALREKGSRCIARRRQFFTGINWPPEGTDVGFMGVKIDHKLLLSGAKLSALSVHFL